MRRAFAALLSVGALLALAGSPACGSKSGSGGSGDATSGSGGADPLCDLGENIFCRCPGGEAGTKTCKADGQSFEACVTRTGPCSSIPMATSSTAEASSSSAGSGGSGGGGGAAPLGQLYDPCGQDSDCDTASCRDGYCTKDCAKFDECDLGSGECVQFMGQQFCMPDCTVDSDCLDSYGAPSGCGYATAADGAPVLTCADWQENLKLPPAGTNCAVDDDCDLGHDGVQLVCSNGKCAKGCHAPSDCPVNTACSATTGLGSCK